MTKSHTKAIVVLFILLLAKKCCSVFGGLIWRCFGIKNQHWKLFVPRVK